VKGDVVTIKMKKYGAVTFKRRSEKHLNAEAAQEAELHAIAATQAEQGELHALLSLLFNGALGRGVTLTQAECRILYEITQGTWKYKRGAPAKQEAPTLRSYSLLLELDGMAVEPAVAKTMEVFGVNRATVFAARAQPRRFPVSERLEQNPALRQQVRELLEAKAVDFRSGKKLGSAKKSK
jgi:hypothetical protein